MEMIWSNFANLSLVRSLCFDYTHSRTRNTFAGEKPIFHCLLFHLPLTLCSVIHFIKCWRFFVCVCVSSLLSCFNDATQKQHWWFLCNKMLNRCIIKFSMNQKTQHKISEKERWKKRWLIAKWHMKVCWKRVETHYSKNIFCFRNNKRLSTFVLVSCVCVVYCVWQWQ